MQKIVHLDLKGAPWKVPYLEQIILLVKSWGATGLLIEWEDTFPYCGDITLIGSQGIGSGDGLYSLDEVKHIIRFAECSGLIVIQLVQTIGHLEFVLKHPSLAILREEPRSPAVLCPSKENSQKLVCEMMNQVLAVQPEAEYLHIGADEVWHAGICTECKIRAEQSPFKVASLYLEHIRYLAMYLKQLKPNLKILMWDDMLRNVSVEALKFFNLGELLEPVIWDYSAVDHFSVKDAMLATYRSVFPQYWAASAYKGANGSCRMTSNVPRYVSNNVAWCGAIKAQGGFAGIVLTGWSRFEHYATMCELLPVSLPSLFSCLKTVEGMLDFGRVEPVIVEDLPVQSWPGRDLALAVQSFAATRDSCLVFLHDDAVCTFLNHWQLSRSYTNTPQVEALYRNAKRLHTEVSSLQPILHTQLISLTGSRSTTEWIETWILPLLTELASVIQKADSRRCLQPSVVPLGL